LQARLFFPGCGIYRKAVSSRSSEPWSLTRSLAFLAATFAMAFTALPPSGVAASPAPEMPVLLCSGERIMVVHKVDGSSEPSSTGAMDCTDCVLSVVTAPPPPPPVQPTAPPRIAAIPPERPGSAPWRGGVLRAGLPPPSTAPPAA